MCVCRVDNVKGLGLAYSLGKFDGILGLGFPSISVDNLEPPFVAMVREGLISEPIFAFYLGQANGQDGELAFGGVDSDKYEGDITWVPLAQENYWVGQDSAVGLAMAICHSQMVTLDGLSLGGTKLESGMAIVDSGTSILAGPPKEVGKLAKEAGAWHVPFIGKYVIECSKADTLPPLDITIGLCPSCLVIWFGLD